MRRLGPLALAMATGLYAQAHGPRNGWLLISGGHDVPRSLGQFAKVVATWGSEYSRDEERFLEMAGGKRKARIVVIPTASVTQDLTAAKLKAYCTDDFGGTQCTVLHTADRAVADSEDFVAPLKTATGVWLEGGRQWRLADAYLGTRTLTEIFGVLDRGGVVAGGSAGASIQGSYLVRGSSMPDDSTIMMAPGHETGFGLFTGVAIDQHVDARGRDNDLAVVMKAHPELLGLGLDQGVSITVHGDSLTVNGPGRVAVWDGKDHDGKGYYYLRTGDSLDTVTRIARLVEHPPDLIHKEITVPEEVLASYVGTYEVEPHEYLTITVEGGRLLGQFPGRAEVQLFPEGKHKFLLKEFGLQVSFDTNAQGKVTHATVHRKGETLSAKRLDDAGAKRAADEIVVSEQRYKNQNQAPGSEAALRRFIEGLRRGDPTYDQLSPELGRETRRQLVQLKARMAKLGEVQTVIFWSVAPDGSNIFDVKFQNGPVEWRITMGPDGKTESVSFRAL